jgi:hypothetical protein
MLAPRTLRRTTLEPPVLSNARPKGNKKPTKDQAEAWTENSGSVKRPRPRGRGTTVKETIADIRDNEKGKQTNDEKDQMENDEHTFSVPEKPSKGERDPRQNREQEEEIETDPDE